jgi:type IV pilus assembly protein PilE
MQRSTGFTLIELMITVVIVAILAAIGIPSYQQHMIKAVRSQGQQFLLDLAQRQEQYFLDARWYASGIATTSTAGRITITTPEAVSAKYAAPAFTVPAQAAGTMPTYVIRLVPLTGSTVASDGRLLINNLGQRWREVDNNNAYDSAKDCAWEKSSCKPTP